MNTFEKSLLFIASIAAASACSVATTLIVLGTAANAQTVSADDAQLLSELRPLRQAISFDGTTLRIAAPQVTIVAGSDVSLTATHGNIALEAPAQTQLPGVFNENGGNVSIGSGQNLSLTSGKGTLALTATTGNVGVTTSGNIGLTSSTGNIGLTSTSGNIGLTSTSGAIAEKAATTLGLGVGASSANFSASGVTLAGTTIDEEAMASAKLNAPTTQVSGTALVTVQGGLVKIN